VVVTAADCVNLPAVKRILPKGRPLNPTDRQWGVNVFVFFVIINILNIIDA